MVVPGTPAFLAIRDLCRRDPRLHVTLPIEVERASVLDANAVDITYAMTMRPLPPFLRALHGGELILIPRRIWGDVAEYVNLEDLAKNGVAAVVLEPGHPLASGQLPEMMAMILADTPVDALLESQLTGLIRERGNELYRLTTELDRRFAALSTSADALPALLAAVSDVSGRGVLLTDTAGLPIYAIGGEQPGYLDEVARQNARSRGRTLIVTGPNSDARLIAPVRTAQGVQGYLSLTGGRNAFTETDRVVVERTALACTFALMRLGPAAGGVRQLGPTPAETERSLRALLLGRLETESAALAECRTLGLDPLRGVSVLLAAPLPDAESESLGIMRSALENAVAGWQPRAFVTELPEMGAIAALLPVPDGEPSRRRVLEIGRRLAQEDNVDAIAVGISDRQTGWQGVSAAFTQAYFALRLGATNAVPRVVVDSGTAGDLGIYQLLYPLWLTRSAAAFAHDMLGDLLAYDEKRGGGLVPTLEAYLDLGGGMQEIADRLFIHRNSLIYRLRRIEELTGRTLSDPHDRLNLHVALKVRQMPDLPPRGGG